MNTQQEAMFSAFRALDAWMDDTRNAALERQALAAVASCSKVVASQEPAAVFLVSTDDDDSYGPTTIHGICSTLQAAETMRDKDEADYIESYPLDSPEAPVKLYDRFATDRPQWRNVSKPRPVSEVSANYAEIAAEDARIRQEQFDLSEP